MDPWPHHRKLQQQQQQQQRGSLFRSVGFRADGGDSCSAPVCSIRLWPSMGFLCTSLDGGRAKRDSGEDFIMKKLNPIMANVGHAAISVLFSLCE